MPRTAHNEPKISESLVERRTLKLSWEAERGDVKDEISETRLSQAWSLVRRFTPDICILVVYTASNL